MKRTRLRPMSKKREVAAREYSAKRTDFLAEHPKCQKCGTRHSTDVHHKAGRLGTNYLDTQTWAALCRRCHDDIHLNPRRARQDGWLI